MKAWELEDRVREATGSTISPIRFELVQLRSHVTAILMAAAPQLALEKAVALSDQIIDRSTR